MGMNRAARRVLYAIAVIEAIGIAAFIWKTIAP